jgi:hypothetical protein
MNSEEAIRIPWQIKELTEQVKCLKVQLEDAERRYRDARIAGVDMEIENEKLRRELEKPREEHLASLVRKMGGTRCASLWHYSGEGWGAYFSTDTTPSRERRSCKSPEEALAIFEAE